MESLLASFMAPRGMIRLGDACVCGIGTILNARRSFRKSQAYGICHLSLVKRVDYRDSLRTADTLWLQSRTLMYQKLTWKKAQQGMHPQGTKGYVTSAQVPARLHVGDRRLRYTVANQIPLGTISLLGSRI